MRYVFAGDRQISVEILQWLMLMDIPPLALMLTEKKRSSHGEELREISKLPDSLIFEGMEFMDNLNLIRKLDVDYVFGIHFPYLIPQEFLDIPKVGFLNLHPSLLPYNKGWHTPSWAILDNTPFGATLHFMVEKLDEGDIIHQKEIEVRPDDTADTLYQRVLKAEVDVFKEAFPYLKTLNPPARPQIGEGTSYNKKDLLEMREISLSEYYKAEDLINKLRALTTNSVHEAVYFIKDGKRIALQISMTEIDCGKEVNCEQPALIKKSNLVKRW